MKERITKHLIELQAERQRRIDLALRNGYRPGFTRDGRVCLVRKEKEMSKRYEPVRLVYRVPIDKAHKSLERNTLAEALKVWSEYHESRTAKINVDQIVRAGGYPVAMPVGQLTIQLE